MDGSVQVIDSRIDNSAAEPDFRLAHLQLRAARAASEMAQATLEQHQAEHGC
jgi:hypothetical protein